jgi:DNA polymerase III subunit delta
MIRLLCGDNDFELTRRVRQLMRQFEGEAERYDAADVTSEQLADIFAGQTLFSIKRLIVLDTPSASSELWQNISLWAERLSGDTELVLIEPKPDKRISAYKWLKKQATIEEFQPMTERDTGKLLAWLEAYASARKISLTAAQARRLLTRGGADQWALAQAVDKLSLAGEVTDVWIDDVIEQTPAESVFALFETALNGDTKRLTEIMHDLRKTEDPYRVFGLVNSQFIQLITLVYGEGDVSKVAADTGAKSSYPLQKLAPYAGRISKSQAKILLEIFASADIRLKTSDADPWLVLENALARTVSTQ